MQRLNEKDVFESSIVATFKKLQEKGVVKTSIDPEKQFAYGKSFVADATKNDDYGIWFLAHSNLTSDKWNDAWKYEITFEDGVCKEIDETFDSSKKKSESELERATKENNFTPTRLIFAKDDKTGKYVFLGLFTVGKSTRSYSYTKWLWKKVNASYLY